MRDHGIAPELERPDPDELVLEYSEDEGEENSKARGQHS